MTARDVIAGDLRWFFPGESRADMAASILKTLELKGFVVVPKSSITAAQAEQEKRG
jgi:hypothetical protein